jgi:hypothetical protein
MSTTADPGVEQWMGDLAKHRRGCSPNLARYATFRDMILQLDEVWSRTPAPREMPAAS